MQLRADTYQSVAGATVYPPNYCSNGPDCYCPDATGHFQCDVTCTQEQPCTLDQMAVMWPASGSSSPQPGFMVIYGSNFCGTRQISMLGYGWEDADDWIV